MTAPRTFPTEAGELLSPSGRQLPDAAPSFFCPNCRGEIKRPQENTLPYCSLQCAFEAKPVLQTHRFVKNDWPDAPCWLCGRPKEQHT